MTFVTLAAVSPDPSAGPVVQQFPELQQISNNLVAALQAVGMSIIGVCVVLIALMVFTSFGNEHRHAITRSAALSLIVGIAILMNADLLSRILQSIFP